jgi:CRISPR-associated endonuclease Csn1
MRILGLDIGTTSIGFALIDLDKDREIGSIVRLGVRIFPEARDADGTPLNQQRRAKRMMRRQLRRRRERRRSLNELLSSRGLLPAFGGDEWRATMSVDPYVLRAKALAEPLAPHEIGRALYHLAKRRHFKERDPAETGQAETEPGGEVEDAPKARGKKKPEPKPDKADDETESTAARAHLVAKLEASGQTLGQALAARPADSRRRGEHATRKVVEAEFDHPAARRDPGLRGAIHEAIFHQRPVFWRKSTLGKCRLMPEEQLCPKGSWLSQERIMLEKVNNLAFTGGNARPLDEEERAAILQALRVQKSLSWGGARTALEPLFKARGMSAKTLRFNHETDKDEKSGLKGNIVEAELAKIFGARWAAHPRRQQLRDFVPEALWAADYGEIGTQRVVIRPEKERASRRADVARKLVEEFGASRAEAEKLVKLHFPQGWDAYSTAALRKLMPMLERGERLGSLLTRPEFAAWRDANFPAREQPTGEILDRLPSPRGDRNATHAQREEAESIKSIRNPTVVRVRNEMRKVVNNLIDAYGKKPDLVRIELARAVGKSKREREEMTNGMKTNERLRNKARDTLIENGLADPTDGAVDKWILWMECGKQCPYSADPIGFDDVFRGNPRFDIEHIWPRSKSLDNSMRNKTLCRKDINVAKGNRLPIDYFGKDSEAWRQAKDRIWKMVGKGGMSPGKAKRFCAESMPDDFADRQLNDTGYAARQAAEFLKRLWPDVGPHAKVKVQPVTGRVTAQLRRLWGLNGILGKDGEKTRADHRHHAIDALVVACADGGYTQKLSQYFKAESENRRQQPDATPDEALLPKPWKHIREDAERAVAKIVVSHRVRKKVSGPLHKETTYGDTGIDVTNSNGTYRLFVTRKRLEALTRGNLEEIRDLGTRQVVKTWVADHGGDLKKAFASLPPRGPEGPPIRKVRLIAPQKMDAMAELKTGFATTGNNHHVAIFRQPDEKIEHEVVSLFDAIKRVTERRPVIRSLSDGGGKLIMSLSLSDTFYIPEGEKAGYWTVKSISGNGQIFSKPINNADPSQSGTWGPSPAPLIRLGARKVSVDPIGRVRPARD